MIALIRLVLAVLASPFKSKSRLEAILSELRGQFPTRFELATLSKQPGRLVSPCRRRCLPAPTSDRVSKAISEFGT
jgi:hypothetical protein